MKSEKTKKFWLIFNDNNISFKITLFMNKAEAEHWRDFLAYTMQEFKYDEMKIIEV